LNRDLLLGVAGALLTGAAIGTQSTLSSRVGSLIGDIHTGILTNFIGGIAAGLLLLMVILRNGPGILTLSRGAVIMLAVSGLLGILIITGISFSLQRAGVAAGLATVILGQMVVSAIVDSLGIGGVEPIPLSPTRVIGLVLLAGSVYLLVPKS